MCFTLLRLESQLSLVHRLLAPKSSPPGLHNVKEFGELPLLMPIFKNLPWPKGIHKQGRLYVQFEGDDIKQQSASVSVHAVVWGYVWVAQQSLV